jgi:cytochrome P450
VEPAVVIAPIDRRSVVSILSQLRKPAGQSNPLPLYRQLRSLGDVVPAPWGGHLVTSYKVCDEVLRDKAWQVPDGGWRARQGDGSRWTAASSREMSRTLPGLNPPHHTRVRRSVGNMFDRRSLGAISSTVAKTVDRLLDQLVEEMRGGHEADFCATVSEQLPIITIGQWLGIPSADYPLLRSFTHDQVFAQELLPSASQLALSDAATAGLREYFVALVRNRRQTPGDDPISAWIRIWDGLEPDQDAADEAVYFLALFVVLAALETTSTLLSTMMWLISGHPRQMDWLRTRPEHLQGAVEEVLRYDSPTHVISRVAGEDLTLAGVPVRKDQMAHLMVGVANHDPARHTDPEIFDVRRRQGAHLSFSGGIHYCLGAPLARLEATALLAGILQRLPRLRVSAPPDWAPRVAFRRITALRVSEH